MKNLFKSLFYSVVLGLAVMVSFTSCDKDEDDDSAATKALIVDKTWKVTDYKSEKGDITFDAVMDMYVNSVQMEIVFEKTNIYTGTIILPELGGASMSVPGTWSLDSDGKSLKFDGKNGTIEKLTATDFEISFAQEDFQAMDLYEGKVLETGRVTMVMEAK